VLFLGRGGRTRARNRGHSRNERLWNDPLWREAEIRRALESGWEAGSKVRDASAP
jgi:hypothetical protein